jgi:hypothetical protein
MGITVTRRGRQPRFNAAGIAREIQRFAPGAIIGRTERGLDIKGQPFAAYSPRYRGQLKRMGEDPKVDLRLSGGLLNSVKARDALLRADSVEVTIAPDTGTSPVWKAKAGGKRRYDRAMRKFEKLSAAGEYSAHVAGRQAARAYRSQRVFVTDEQGKRSAKQSPPHSIVGYWLHFGTPTMRARPWMGLDPTQEEYLRKRIAAIMWK